MPGMLPPRVTHDEIRALLAPYAAAVLDASRVEAVQAHLMTGCVDCLDELYRRPVGVVPRPRLPDGTNHIRRRSGWRLAGSIGLLAMVLGVGIGWLAKAPLARPGPDGMTLGTAERAALEGDRVELEARLAAATSELTALRDVTARGTQQGAVGVNARLAELERNLQATTERVQVLVHDVQQRDEELERVRAELAEVRMLRNLLGSPGVQLVRLEPVAPFREGRGHALWQPARGELVVYAFDLPEPPPGVRYWVRLVGDGSTTSRTALLRDGRGPVLLPWPFDPAGARLRRIEIIRDPADRPVLAGQVSTLH